MSMEDPKFREPLFRALMEMKRLTGYDCTVVMSKPEPSGGANSKILIEIASTLPHYALVPAILTLGVNVAADESRLQMESVTEPKEGDDDYEADCTAQDERPYGRG